MQYLTLKSKAVALGTVVLVALVATGCGGNSHKSSSSSGFVASANAACNEYYTTEGSVLETVGEQYKPFTGPWAAGKAGGQAVALHSALVSQQGLKPPSGEAAIYKTKLSDLQQGVNILNQEKAAATSGNAASFKSLDAKYAAVVASVTKLDSQMGLSACAGKGISSADQAKIKYVIGMSAVNNSPTQCTKDFTLAFVKQMWGSMAGCIKAGKQPVGPTNPRIVHISAIAGAGDFATADTTFVFAGGKTRKFSITVYRQNGSWRLLGFQNA